MQAFMHCSSLCNANMWSASPIRVLLCAGSVRQDLSSGSEFQSRSCPYFCDQRQKLLKVLHTSAWCSAKQGTQCQWHYIVLDGAEERGWMYSSHSEQCLSLWKCGTIPSRWGIPRVSAGERDVGIHPEPVHFQKDAGLASAPDVSLVITNRALKAIRRSLHHFGKLEWKCRTLNKYLSAWCAAGSLVVSRLPRKPHCPSQGTCQNGVEREAAGKHNSAFHWF